VNSGDCTCGSANCNTTLGLFCDRTFNDDACSKKATCANTNASTSNSGDCQCGTKVCSSSEVYCNATLSACSDVTVCADTTASAENTDGNCLCGNAKCTSS
jgi:hypothetical protein